jgi:hypothetical protein
MRAIRLGILSAALLGCAPTAPTAPTALAQADVPPAVQEVLKPFTDEAAAIDRKVEAEVRKSRDRAAAELKTIQDAFCREAKLDEAVAVRDLIRSFRAGTSGALPADLPAAAREVYQQHEREVVEIQKNAEAEAIKLQDRAAAELKKLQDHFCREAKLDEAVAIRDFIRSLRDGVSNALPDPGYVNNQATDIGKVFFYDVTGVASGQSIYGTDVYTTGSHLGMAAVHCGLLEPGQRGVVKVTILPGEATYAATTRHGVTSIGYGQWGVSFKVEKAYWFPRGLSLNVAPGPATLVGHRAEVGKSFLFEVTGSDAGGVWGTDVYTDDSTLARAAVHAGALEVGQKGIVRVTVLPGQAGYVSSTRHGVSSGSWGKWVGSFRVEPVR